jgi:hypothetical protein
MILKFEEWLNNQQSRQDQIGDLARLPGMQEVEQTSARRGYDEHKNWVDIVLRIPDPRQIPVFNDAWQEFQLAKRAAKDAAD